MTKCTAVRLSDLKKLKRDARREKNSNGSRLSHVLDENAQLLGFKHWADLMRIVYAFENGCVYGYLHLPLDGEEVAALESIGFRKADYLYPYASADLLAREHRVTAELRAAGMYREEDRDQDKRSRFRKANPLYGVSLFALPPDLCVGHSTESIQKVTDRLIENLNKKLFGPDSISFPMSPDYIWFGGVRTDIGMGFSSHLPPELEYAEQELDDMEYATALEATAG